MSASDRASLGQGMMDQALSRLSASPQPSMNAGEAPFGGLASPVSIMRSLVPAAATPNLSVQPSGGDDDDDDDHESAVGDDADTVAEELESIDDETDDGICFYFI